MKIISLRAFAASHYWPASVRVEDELIQISALESNGSRGISIKLENGETWHDCNKDLDVYVN